MALLQATYRDAGAVTVLDLSGRITLGEGSALLRSTIRELLADQRVRILVNLGDINYIDSSGIATLIEVLKRSQHLKKEFVLFGLSPAVQEVFRLTHVIRIFRVFDTEQEALEAA